jgi:hypothetical protein
MGSKIRNIPNFGRIRENLANANIELSRNYGNQLKLNNNLLKLNNNLLKLNNNLLKLNNKQNKLLSYSKMILN